MHAMMTSGTRLRSCVLSWLLVLAATKWRSLVPFQRAVTQHAGTRALLLDVGSNDGKFTSDAMKYLRKLATDNSLGCTKQTTSLMSSSVNFITFEPQARFRDGLENLLTWNGISCRGFSHEFQPVAAWTRTGNISFVMRRDSV